MQTSLCVTIKLWLSQSLYLSFPVAGLRRLIEIKFVKITWSEWKIVFR